MPCQFQGNTVLFLTIGHIVDRLESFEQAGLGRVVEEVALHELGLIAGFQQEVASLDHIGTRQGYVINPENHGSSFPKARDHQVYGPVITPVLKASSRGLEVSS